VNVVARLNSNIRRLFSTLFFSLNNIRRRDVREQITWASGFATNLSFRRPSSRDILQTCSPCGHFVGQPVYSVSVFDRLFFVIRNIRRRCRSLHAHKTDNDARLGFAWFSERKPETSPPSHGLLGMAGAEHSSSTDLRKRNVYNASTNRFFTVHGLCRQNCRSSMEFGRTVFEIMIRAHRPTIRSQSGDIYIYT